MIRSLVLAALGAALLQGCSLPGGPPIGALAAEVNATLANETFVVAPSDVLQVRFRQAAEYDQEVGVAPDGTGDFLDVGSVHVSGYSLEQIRDLLADAYAERTNGDSPSVSILEASPRTVTVMGEVGAPGEVALGPDQRLTLVEAIGQAGGFRRNTAWLSNTLLVRWDAEAGRQLWWRIDARPSHWDTETPMYLQAFDVVYVPNTNIDHVDIWVDNFIRRLIPLPLPIAY
ncbi:MAG: polysaccharide biosynthesis/export family protein [Planctomycetota bacterium]